MHAIVKAQSFALKSFEIGSNRADLKRRVALLERRKDFDRPGYFLTRSPRPPSG